MSACKHGRGPMEHCDECYREAVQAMFEQKTVRVSHSIQHGGDHYKNMGVQPWTAMEAWMTPAQFEGFLRGNVIKYIARCDAKGSKLEDLKKAQHYLTKLIELEPQE